jgi:hypothetical protein
MNPKTPRYQLFGLKSQEGQLVFTQKLALSIQSWVCVHPDDVFYFQDANEVNGI